MNSAEQKRREQLTRLLADRALAGLDASEEARVETLLRACPDVAEDELDLAAAALSMAFLENVEPLPAGLRDRIARRLQRSR